MILFQQKDRSRLYVRCTPVRWHCLLSALLTDSLVFSELFRQNDDATLSLRCLLLVCFVAR